MAGLTGVFALRQTGHGRFYAPPTHEGGARVYGGHMLCQALLAAAATVEGKDCHTISARFLKVGSPDQPFEYIVCEAQEGRSFSVRQIDVLQGDTLCLIATASFQRPTAGVSFQYIAMPVVDAPEGLEPEYGRTTPILTEFAEQGERMQLLPSGIDGRWVDPQDHTKPVVKSAKRDIWLRITEPLPEHPASLVAGLGFLTDYSIVETALRPHGRTWVRPDTQAASLDHSIWFHRPSDPTRWHLLQTQAVVTGGERAFVRGEMFSSQGQLVASIAQEALFRTL